MRSEVYIAARRGRKTMIGVSRKRRARRRKSAALKSSVSGYENEMGCLQDRHCPRRNTKLRRGMRSVHARIRLQRGQAERFPNIPPCGMRWRSIVAKLPKQRPIKAMMTIWRGNGRNSSREARDIGSEKWRVKSEK